MNAGGSLSTAYLYLPSRLVVRPGAGVSTVVGFGWL